MNDRVHSIRLHGPWRAKVVRTDSTPTLDAPQTQKKFHVPGDWGDWLGFGFRGVVAFERSFGMPTGLEDDQEIWLVIEQVDYRAKIWLNSDEGGVANNKMLGELQLGQSPFRAPIRNLMQARNRLHFEIELPADAERGERASLGGGLIGEVRLEIV